MLRKPPLVTVVPGSPGQPYVAPSTVCTPPPPPNDGGGGAPGSGGETAYYVYVPTNPANPAGGETRTPYAAHPGTGYTCDVTPQMYFVSDPLFPGALVPVWERRCYWSYP